MDLLGFLKDVSVIVASLAATYGIGAWRREYRGKKQAELAEEALRLFYEGRDAIGHIRNPFAYGEEGKTRKSNENETPEEKEAYDRAYVLLERNNTHIELFNKIHSMRYKFMAQFGGDSGKPFDDFRQIVNELVVSAQTLAGLWAEQLRDYRLEARVSQNAEFIKNLEKVFWQGLVKDDPINPRVEECIKNIEGICRPIIDNRWKFRFWGRKQQ